MRRYCVAAAPGMNGYGYWLTHLPHRLGWSTRLVARLGTHRFCTGCVGYYQRTGSETQFALNFLFLVLPRVVLAPFAGALVDRWDRRSAMIVGDTGAAMGTLVIALLMFAGQLQVWHIYVATAVSASFSTLQRPAWSASVHCSFPKTSLDGRMD